MTKSTKIMLSVIGAVLAVCIAITAIVSISKKNEQGNASTNENQSELVTTDANGNNAVPDISGLILGKWSDSANMSGYEFAADGSVVVTYVNLTVPVVNMPINGSAKGTYVLSGNDLTVKFSIYSKTITKEFTASIENNALTLKNKQDGDVATYEKTGEVSGGEQASSQNTQIQNGIVGAWKSGDSTVKYIFEDDSKVTVVYKDAKDAAVSSGKLNGSFNGVYMLGDGNVTIQFSYNSKKITQKYTYVISGSTMSFTDSGDDTTIFVRSEEVKAGADALLGKWSDSTGMSGYEFKENGIVNITYVNFVVPVINMPIDGTVAGSYIVKGNTVTISASVYSKTIKNTYTFAIDGNTLVLTDTEDSSNVSTYIKK